MSLSFRKNVHALLSGVTPKGAWTTAAVLVVGLAGAGVAPASASSTAAGAQPLHHIDLDGIVSLVGMPYVGSELRMGAPGEFSGCDKTDAAPDGYSIEWLSNGTPLPPERQVEPLKILPSDRGDRLSFNVYATTPEKPQCGDSMRGDQSTLLHSEETAPIAASNRANGWTGRGNFELMGRTDDGELVLYPRTYTYGLGACDQGLCPSYETAQWDQPRLVGTGWQVFDKIIASGDLSGDGNVDILGRDRAGYMHQYRSDGQGGWEGAGTWGPGWGVMTDVIGAGSYTHNLGEAIHWGHTVTRNDTIAISPQGDLLKYSGFVPTAQTIGTGWDIFRSLI
jgi:hypothetical protein